MAEQEVEAERRLDQLESRLGFKFKERPLLREAMTHTSWINERGVAGRDNERLEYLGDAVLELVAGEYLFKRFPGYDEGQLTQIRSSLVSTVALARLGEELLLGETLRLGRGATKSGARRLTSLHANAFEALVGATFLDQGYRRAGRIFLSRIGDLSAWTDPNFKGRLQAVAQEKLGAPPQYRTGPVGDARSRQYLAQVVVEGHGFLGEGRGGTKQAAEQAAAKIALDALMAPVSKKRRRRGAATVPSTASAEPSPASVPVGLPAGEGAALPSEPPAPGRRRRRSRSKPAAVAVVAAEEAAGPVSLPPALPAGVPPEPIGASSEVAATEAPARRRRRRSRSKAPEVAPEEVAVATLAPPAPTVPAADSSAGEAPAGRRRRRRSRAKVAPAPGGEVSEMPAAPATAGAPAPESTASEAATGRRRRRRSGRTRVAGSESAEAAAEPLTGVAEALQPTPATRSAGGPAPAGADEAGGGERRPRRSHRGGRRRTGVVVSSPE